MLRDNGIGPTDQGAPAASDIVALAMSIVDDAGHRWAVERADQDQDEDQ